MTGDGAKSWRMVTLAAGLLLAGGAMAQGQCSYDWLSGPGQDFGLDNDVYALTTWDPDGAGPQPELLIAGGLMNQVSGVSIRPITAWNGSRGSALGTRMGGGGPGLAGF